MRQAGFSPPLLKNLVIHHLNFLPFIPRDLRISEIRMEQLVQGSLVWYFTRTHLASPGIRKPSIIHCPDHEGSTEKGFPWGSLSAP